MTETTHTILVVDDDADIRQCLVEALEIEGFRAAAAINGLDALQQLQRTPSPPCLILLDLMMPVMDGFQFLEERDKNPALRAIPVAVITAAGMSERTSPASLRVPVIPKPIHLPKLMQMVEQLC